MHVNLPVILQYFFCCRFMTVQATKDAHERMELEAEEAEHEEKEEKLLVSDEEDEKVRTTVNE